MDKELCKGKVEKIRQFYATRWLIFADPVTYYYSHERDNYYKVGFIKNLTFHIVLQLHYTYNLYLLLFHKNNTIESNAHT